MRFHAGAFPALLPLALFFALGCSASNFRGAPCVDCAEAGAGGGSDGAVDGTVPEGSTMDVGAPPDDGAAPPDAEGGAGSGCPTKGGKMRRITQGAVNFCIDQIEVTGQTYNIFYQEAGKGLAAPLKGPDCSTKTAANQPPMGDLVPVTEVDWCDAFAFCAWAGKRLCGRVGGGPLVGTSDRADPGKNEWLYACSNGGSLAYPYGNAYQPAVCNDTGSGPRAFNSGTNQCTGGFTGLHDMSGNVREWISACAGMPSDACVSVGGAFGDNAPQLTCASQSANLLRTSTTGDVGFRCCAD